MITNIRFINYVSAVNVLFAAAHDLGVETDNRHYANVSILMVGFVSTHRAFNRWIS